MKTIDMITKYSDRLDGDFICLVEDFRLISEIDFSDQMRRIRNSIANWMEIWYDE